MNVHEYGRVRGQPEIILKIEYTLGQPGRFWIIAADHVERDLTEWTIPLTFPAARELAQDIEDRIQIGVEEYIDLYVFQRPVLLPLESAKEVMELVREAIRSIEIAELNRLYIMSPPQ
jgi:hypothetical protein